MVIQTDGRKTYYIAIDGTKKEILIMIGQDHLPNRTFTIVLETDTEIEEITICSSQEDAEERMRQHEINNYYEGNLRIVSPGWLPKSQPICIHCSQ
jgi:hypothetical protein